jgi:hypothetical protein
MLEELLKSIGDKKIENTGNDFEDSIDYKSIIMKVLNTLKNELSSIKGKGMMGIVIKKKSDMPLESEKMENE